MISYLANVLTNMLSKYEPISEDDREIYKYGFDK